MFLEKSISAELTVSKMIAEIVSVNHPEIYSILKEVSFEDIAKVSKLDSIGGVKEYLLIRGISSEAVTRFMLDYSKSLLRMDSTLLLYDYFQLDHIQSKVRSLARRNPKLKKYTLGRDLTDLQWTFVSARLGEFLSDRPYPFRPELVHIEHLYERALDYCLKGVDLYNSDFSKKGLNQEIGETTITLLHNQRETIDFDSISDDLTNFSSIAMDIYRASKQLWKHTQNGSPSRDFVMYDLVSRLQENIMADVRDNLSKELRLRTKGRTSLAPQIEFIKTHGIPGSSVNTQKILDYKISDREAQLQPLDILLKGIASSTDIYNARVEFFNSTFAATDRDGRVIYKGMSISNPKVDESLNIIVKGYAALKVLIDFCRKVGFNFLRIPTHAFRDQSIAKRYNSFKHYVEFVEVALRLERESRENNALGLKSNELVYGEDMLQLKQQLSTSLIADIYQEEEFKDLTFVRDWMTKGFYTPEKTKNHNIFRTIYAKTPSVEKIWNFLVDKKILDKPNGFEWQFMSNSPNSVYANLWLRMEYPKEKLESMTEDEKWAYYKFYFVLIPRQFMQDPKASEESTFFMYVRTSFLLRKLEDTVRPFMNTIVETVDGVTKLKSEEAMFRLFHENQDIIKLLSETTTYRGVYQIIKELEINHYYSIYNDDSVTERSLVNFLSNYMKEYSRIFDYIRHLYRKYVMGVVESFTEVSKGGFAVNEESLLELCYSIYNLPVNEEAGLNTGYMFLKRNSSVDPNTGIFMDKTGMKPVVIKSDKKLLTYVHENGYILEIYNNKTVLERPIERGEKIVAES